MQMESFAVPHFLRIFAQRMRAALFCSTTTQPALLPAAPSHLSGRYAPITDCIQVRLRLRPSCWARCETVPLCAQKNISGVMVLQARSGFLSTPRSAAHRRRGSASLGDLIRVSQSFPMVGAAASLCQLVTEGRRHHFRYRRPSGGAASLTMLMLQNPQ